MISSTPSYLELWFKRKKAPQDIFFWYIIGDMFQIMNTCLVFLLIQQVLHLFAIV